MSFTEGGYLRWSLQDGVEQRVCLMDTTFVKEHVQGVTLIVLKIKNSLKWS